MTGLLTGVVVVLVVCHTPKTVINIQVGGHWILTPQNGAQTYFMDTLILNVSLIPVEFSWWAHSFTTLWGLLTILDTAFTTVQMSKMSDWVCSGELPHVVLRSDQRCSAVGEDHHQDQSPADNPVLCSQHPHILIQGHTHLAHCRSKLWVSRILNSGQFSGTFADLCMETDWATRRLL